jgi:hypothetical protein
MSIIVAPSLLILINLDLSDNVLAAIVRQMYITEVITGAVFDQRVANNPAYATTIHNSGTRLLVMRNLYEMNNRALFDIVLFAKAGLITVEANKYGPPNITLPIDKATLTALINLQKPFPRPENPPDLDDGFVGETDNDNFNPNRLDPETNIEPSNL